MSNHLETGKLLYQALEQGMDRFRALAGELGYSLFEAHDLKRVYDVFAKVAEHEDCPFETVMQQASQVRFIKLSLISQIIDKQPASWQYWIDMAENLPLQDLRDPVQQALHRLNHDARSKA